MYFDGTSDNACRQRVTGISAGAFFAWVALDPLSHQITASKAQYSEVRYHSA